ncbi:hypothetical protein ES705_33861 [subsurface metagenome]
MVVTEIQKYINCLKNRIKEVESSDEINSTSDFIRQRVGNEVTILNVVIRDLEKVEDSGFTYWSYEDKGEGGE